MRHGLYLHLSAGFKRPRARLLCESKKVWMFDNEIDWVTYMECSLVRREAHQGGRTIYVCDIQDTRPSTKVGLFVHNNLSKCSKH